LGKAVLEPVEVGCRKRNAKRQIRPHDECIDDRRGKCRSVSDILKNDILYR
jgi:hypothetical protein